MTHAEAGALGGRPKSLSYVELCGLKPLIETTNERRKASNNLKELKRQFKMRMVSVDSN